DDSHPLHAIAVASFVGASIRELSFQRGAELLLYRRLNEHWWEGQAATESDGPRYLVPHLYVKLLVEGTPLTSIPARDPTTTASATIDESTSGVDDDATAVSTSTPTTVPAASPPKKPQRHAVDDGSISSPGVVTPTLTLGRFSRIIINTTDHEYSSTRLTYRTSTSYPVVTTPDSYKDITHGASSTSDGSRSVTSPTDCQIETGNADVENPPEVDKKESAYNDKEIDYVKRYTSADENEVSDEQESASTPSSSSSLMTRSMSNSPPPLSPQRRAGNRCSWAGAPTSSPSAAPVASTVPGLETLPEDRLANIKPSLRSPTTESAEATEHFSTSNGSLNEVDSALAEVMRGMASLEKDRSQGPKVSTTAAQRSRELEQKMRLPSAAKHTSDFVLELPDRPQPPNWGRALSKSKEEDLSGPIKNAADTFAEQAGGTVRKRVGTQLAHLPDFSKPLTTSTSLSNDLGRSESAPKPVAAAATWWSTRKLVSQAEGEGKDGVMSKSVSESKSVEMGNVTTTSATDSPVPIKRGSIAARVAAFEASTNSGSTTGNTSSARPSRMKRT
ncbi:SLIT-ROBO Rho GTPase-activating protein 1, partial [Taenia solium]